MFDEMVHMLQILEAPSRYQDEAGVLGDIEPRLDQ